MKKTTYLVVVALFLTQCGAKKTNIETNYSNKEEKQEECVVLGEQLKSELEYDNKYNLKLTFTPIEKHEYDLNQDGVKEEIIIEKLEEWNDPGDFHRISIRIKDTCYTFFNDGGWDKPTLGAHYLPNLETINKIDSEYIIISKSNNNILLFAFGYIYASNPGILSIVNLNVNEKPQLLFNDNYLLYDYEEGSPYMILSRNFPEEESVKKDTLELRGCCLHKL